MKIVGLIPARAGSKGIPGKNTRLLLGKPLIQHTFENARASGVLQRIILSTDAPDIAACARAIGIEVPFLRPSEFASDESPMIDVAVHALEYLCSTQDPPDALLLLQPTSPLRRPEHILEAARLLGDNDSVCSVTPIPKVDCPHSVMKIDDTGFLRFFMPDGHRYTRRQDIPPAYKREGTIYLTRTSVLLAERTFYGGRCVPMVIPTEESLSIDDLSDWEEAERRMRERQKRTALAESRSSD